MTVTVLVTIRNNWICTGWGGNAILSGMETCSPIGVVDQSGGFLDLAEARTIRVSGREAKDIRVFAKAQTPASREAVTVRCVTGIAWVTCEGDADDHVLRAGEQMVFAHRAGKAVVQALSDQGAVVRVIQRPRE